MFPKDIIIHVNPIQALAAEMNVEIHEHFNDITKCAEYTIKAEKDLAKQFIEEADKIRPYGIPFHFFWEGTKVAIDSNFILEWD